MNSLIDILNKTMAVERLAGVSVYVLALTIVYFRIKKANIQQIPRILRVYQLVLCMMAFFYIPGIDADLTTWRTRSAAWMGYSPRDFLLTYAWDTSSPLSYTLMYLCRRSGIPGLLPMIAAFVFYQNTFHILTETARRKNTPPNIVAVFLLFVMASGRFLEVISGIRCMMAFSIVVRLFFDEVFAEKKMIRHILFYIAACLIHPAAVAVTLIRLACFLMEGRNGWSKAYNMLLMAAAGVIMATVGLGLWKKMMHSATRYLGYDVYSNLWEYLITALSLAVIILYLIRYIRIRREATYETKKIVWFSVIFLVIEVCMVSTYTIFQRFAAINVLICPPYFEGILSASPTRKQVFLLKTTKVISLLMLFLACMRGNLSGYKFLLFHW